MTKQQEIEKLRELPNHYLWEMPRNQWTAQDVENLKNPTADCFVRKMRSVRKKARRIITQVKEVPRVSGVIAKITKPYVLTEQYQVFESSMNHLID